MSFLTLQKLENKKYSWLKKSKLYESFDLEDNIEQELNLIYISSMTNDFIKMLETIVFWRVYYYPMNFYKLFIKMINEKSLEYYEFKSLIFSLEDLEIEFLESLFFANFNNYSIIAARCNRIDCLTFFYNSNYVSSLNECYYAASSGSFDALKFCHKNGCCISNNDLEVAVKKGDLKCVKYLFENGCKWTFLCCEHSTKHQGKYLLQYLHENGAKWNYKTVERSIINGNYEALVYAYENGCDFRI